MEPWKEAIATVIAVVGVLAFVAWIAYGEGRWQFMVHTREQLERGEKPAWLCRWLR